MVYRYEKVLLSFSSLKVGVEAEWGTIKWLCHVQYFCLKLDDVIVCTSQLLHNLLTSDVM